MTAVDGTERLRVMARTAQELGFRLTVDPLSVLGVVAELEELRSVTEELVRYTDAHRWTVTGCTECPAGRCYEEWAVLRDELRSMVGELSDG